MSEETTPLAVDGTVTTPTPEEKSNATSDVVAGLFDDPKIKQAVDALLFLREYLGEAFADVLRRGFKELAALQKPKKQKGKTTNGRH